MTGTIVLAAVAVAVSVAYGLVFLAVERSKQVAEHLARWRYREGARALARVNQRVAPRARSGAPR